MGQRELRNEKSRTSRQDLQTAAAPEASNLRSSSRLLMRRLTAEQWNLAVAYRSASFPAGNWLVRESVFGIVIRSGRPSLIVPKVGVYHQDGGGYDVQNSQATEFYFRKRAVRWGAGCDCAGEGQGQGWLHRAVDRGAFQPMGSAVAIRPILPSNCATPMRRRN